jgi:phosphoserine phosphatase
MYLKNKPYSGTRVILLRHGESTYNAMGLYQGCSDESVLTEKGKYAARQTGVFLRGIKFSAIYSSPLKRVQETAQEIQREIASNLDQKELNVTDKLRENELPSWEGLPFQYVRDNLAVDYQKWKNYPDQFKMEIPTNKIGTFDRECYSLIENKPYFYPAQELYHRVEQFWQEILPRHINQTILIVTHGGTNRALISTAIGLKADRYHTIGQSNCAINILNFPDNSLNSGQVQAVNLTTHIEKNIPKFQAEGLLLFLMPLGENIPNLIPWISQFIKDTTIDFSVTKKNHNFPKTTSQILQNHPETLHLQISQQNFVQVCQETIENRNKSMKMNKLISGFIVASQANIQQLIGQNMGLNYSQIHRLKLEEGTVSIIHYPNQEHLPILQGMNILPSPSKFLLN